MKGQSEFVIITWAPDGQGLGSKPCTISPYFSTAVQSKFYS